MTYAYRLIPGGNVDETGPHRGAPPTQAEIEMDEMLALHRKLLYGPYDAVITQVLPIEEVKKRYPNTLLPEE